jgi:RNA polymerase sigma factor (sigma-70 family)
MQRDLAIRARAGDHEAFTQLVDGSITRLFAVAALILRDQDRAHDAVQEALVSAWRDIRGLRDPDAVDAWLRRLVVRACYRQSRADRRRTIVERLVEPAVSPSMPDHALSIIDRDRLERGFARLGTDHRAVLVLHLHVGLPLPEVATTLDIPLGTAKSRLHRAIAAMRSALEADDRTDLVVEGSA